MKIGHVHLTVSNLDESLAFYRDLLGFQVTQRYGDSAVFLSDSGYHHHIALNIWAGADAKPAPEGHTGLYHLAVLFDTRKELAEVLKKFLVAEYPITGFADHGVSESIYLDDPDGNGVELYVDRPEENWPRQKDGTLSMVTEPLDLENLLSEIE